jgi:hypothetical protein
MMQKQSSIVVGVVLILAGILFLVMQAFPELAAQIDLEDQWPLIIVGIGGLLLVGALIGTPSLAVPGTVVSGIGLLLSYQNTTGNWESWAYAWALIPGFVGLGLMLMGVLDVEKRAQIRDGLRLVLISMALFLVFGGFLGAFGQFWPVLLIIGGVFLLFRGRGRGDKGAEPAQAKNDSGEADRPQN